MEVVLFNNLEVVIERKSFRRSLSVYVYPDRPITVKANRLASQKVILAFLKSKEDWIQKHYSRVLLQKRKWPSRTIKFCEKFPFRGRELSLRPVITLQKKFFFSKTDDEVLMHVPRDQWSQSVFSKHYPEHAKKLRDFYKRESIQYLGERLEHFSKQMNLLPKKIRWSEPRTRWGSCSSKGSIQLNWRMIVFPDPIIDYIIVHELSHLKHMNHSKAFWGFVEKTIPDYKIRMKQLNDMQMMAEFLSFSEPVLPENLESDLALASGQ